MSEEIKETNNQETIVENNGSMTAEEQAAMKAQLEEERQARVQYDADLASSTARITVLEADISAREEVEKSATVITELQEQSKVALAKYREAIVLANPDIPEALISGDSFQALSDSVEKGKTVVDAVSENMKAAAAAGTVPAGSPERGEITLNGLSAREKISAGIK